MLTYKECLINLYTCTHSMIYNSAADPQPFGGLCYKYVATYIYLHTQKALSIIT